MAVKQKWKSLVLCVTCLCLTNYLVSCSKEVIMNLTSGFAKVLETCKQEVGVGDHVMKDFYNFWKEDYALLNKDFGCTIMCVASKLDMVTEDNQLHHGNAHDFAKKHGADDGTAKQLVDIIHDCEKSSIGFKDDCIRVLEIAKCFRTRIHQLNWAPSMEVVMEEVLTDV